MKHLKKVSIQAILIFITGCMILYLSGADGNKENATFWQYVGGGTCILGVAWIYIGSLISRL